MQERKDRENNIARRRGKRNTAIELALAVETPTEGCQLTFVAEGEASQYLKDIKRELLCLFGFTPIPPPILCGPYCAKKENAVGEQKRLRDIHRSVLIILRLYAYGKDYCFPSRKTLSKILGQERDYIKRILRDLDNVFSLISRNERFKEDGSQTSNITKLCRLEKEWVKDFDQKIAAIAGRPVKVTEFRSVHEDHQSTYDSIGIDNLVLIHYAGALSPSAFITLCLLIVLHKMRIYYFSGYDLADIRGVSKSKIYRDLDEIEATGLVEIAEKKRGLQRNILHKYPSLDTILDYCKSDVKYIQALSKIIEDVPAHVLHQIFGEQSVDKIIDGLISVSTSTVAVGVPYSTPPPGDHSGGVPYSTPPTSSGNRGSVPYSTPGVKSAGGVPYSTPPLSQIVPPLNNRYIEEMDNNVIKNQSRGKRGKHLSKAIPNEVVEEIKSFVNDEICIPLEDLDSLNNYVFLAELIHDKGLGYVQIMLTAKSRLKESIQEGGVRDKKKLYNHILREYMKESCKIDIPKMGET